jgi:transposase-like protein
MKRKRKTDGARGNKADGGTPLRPSKYQLFPAHTPERLAALRASVRERGVEVPVIRDQDGNLLDGWGRAAAAEEEGAPCPAEVREFRSEAEKYQLILALNCQRRQLSREDRRRLVAAYLTRDPEIADNYLAEIIGGVSKNTVAAVRRQLEAADQIGKFTALRGKDGRKRPVKYKKVLAGTPRELEKALAAIKDLPDSCAGKTLDTTTAARRARRNRGRAGREGRAAGPPPGDAVRLFHCPFQRVQEEAGIEPGSVKLVLTDIPYGRAFLDQLDELGALARRVLAEGGLFVTYSGHAYLDRVMQTLGKYLTYRWMIASVWDGAGNVFQPLQVVSRWKPILVFSRGGWVRRTRWGDVTHVNSREKDWHPWQQPLAEAEALLLRFSEAADLVLDPCGGGFTVASACQRRGRRCVSCDVDAGCVRRGWDRLAEAGGGRVAP